jgi:hypothetical protein
MSRSYAGAAMTLIMRDSTNPRDIPLDGLAAVGGYGDGRFTWPSEGWARFQQPIVPLSIVVSAAHQGDILDVEDGASSPSDCPGWADRFNRPHRRRPTIYCNRSTIDAVRRAMGGRPFDYWAATLDGTRDVPGAVCVQFAGEAMTGGHYDESVIHDPDWIGSSAVPQPPVLTNPADHWWGPYVEGADEVVELTSHCHAPVFQVGGHWFRNTTSIGVPALGEFAEWVLANRVNGVWFVMDESGGPQGQGPAGRLPVDQAFWIDDAVTNSSGCGGTDPPMLVAAGRGTHYRIR